MMDATSVPDRKEPVVQRTEASMAEAEARRLFQRVLAGWAMDVLALRRAGLDRPTWRPCIPRYPVGSRQDLPHYERQGRTAS
jgi:hypothetical protein